jgi:dienelactone hydrolase
LSALQAKAQSAPLGVIGFSLGAFWSLWLAQERPRSLAAAVVFYGSRADDYAKTRSAFLGHFADWDEYESRTARQKLEKELKRTGHKLPSLNAQVRSTGFSNPTARIQSRPDLRGAERFRPCINTSEAQLSGGHSPSRAACLQRNA